MVAVSKAAIEEFQGACHACRIDFSEGVCRDLVVGLRTRLHDIADNASHEDQLNAAAFVLQPLYTELREASAGSGLDREAFVNCCGNAM